MLFLNESNFAAGLHEQLSAAICLRWIGSDFSYVPTYTPVN